MKISRATAVSSRAAETHHAQRSWLLALALVAATLAAYQPTWHAGFIGWDDISYVTDNQALRSLGGLERIWIKPGTTPQYYPLVYTTLWVEYHLWGVQPFGYHLVNILLHGLNAVVVWFVLKTLKLPGSWWAAAIYALHPVCVESVAWVTELKNTQSGMFFFLSMLCFLRFRLLTGRDAAHVWDWQYYPLLLAMFLCALLSKTATCPLPAVLLLLVWWKTGRVERRDILALAPLFVLGIVSGFTTSWMEKHYAGVRGSEWELTFVQSCLVAGRGLWFYAGKLFWPQNLTFIYPRWEIDTSVAWQYLFPLAAVVVFIALWLLRSRIGRGPLVAVLCFAGTLVPALDFFNQYYYRYSYVADRLQYLACVGLISLAVGTGTVICERAGRRGRNWGTLAAVIVLLILGVCTWRQACVYQDFETLWGDTLMKNPQCWVAHLNLANVFSREGKLNDAIGHYEQALRIKPDYVEAHANLAFVLFRMGRTGEAIEHYQQALRIQPDYAEAHNGLGFVLLQLGRPKEAIEHWEQALRIRPNYAAAHYNLGIALAQMGREPEAMKHWEEALRLKPDDVEMHYNLGNALEQQGRVPEAIDQYEQALKLRPDFTAASDALARLRAGR